MREEYFFSKAERGKFYSPDARFNLPVYLDEEVQTFVQAIAEKRRTDLSTEGPLGSGLTYCYSPM